MSTVHSSKKVCWEKNVCECSGRNVSLGAAERGATPLCTFRCDFQIFLEFVINLHHQKDEVTF